MWLLRIRNTSPFVRSSSFFLSVRENNELTRLKYSPFVIRAAAAAAAAAAADDFDATLPRSTETTTGRSTFQKEGLKEGLAGTQLRVRQITTC